MHKMKKLFTEKAEPHNVSFDQMPSEAHNARVKVKQTAQTAIISLTYGKHQTFRIFDLEEVCNVPYLCL